MAPILSGEGGAMVDHGVAWLPFYLGGAMVGQGVA